MASAVYNEGMIMQNLSYPSDQQTTLPIRQAALLATMDAWDRDLKREAFGEILGTAMPLQETLSRLEILYGIADLIASGKFELSYVTNTIEDNLQKAEIHRHNLIKHMELVAQCPDDGDTKH